MTNTSPAEEMRLKVAVIFGGKSVEHEVSLKSATNIVRAMDRNKFFPVLLGIDPSGGWFYNVGYGCEFADLAANDYFAGATSVYLFPSGPSSVDVVDRATNEILTSFGAAFPIVHGTYGEDGTLQGILKALNVPFVGPGISGSAVAMDKDTAKRILRESGIPVAASYTLYKHAPNEYAYDEIAADLGLPLFVKPANAGSSAGVSKVSAEEEYEAALVAAFELDNKILVEEAVIGKELECGILGNERKRPSVVGEIVATETFYSYDAKYLSPAGAVLRIPADVDSAVSERVRGLAVKACDAMGCEGMARVDFLLSETGKLVLNEINTLPGFTEISMYPKLWEHTGIPETDLITELITLAVQRHERDSNLSVRMK